MKKISFYLLIIFFGKPVFGQSDLTPFSDTYSMSTDEAKSEIGHVVNRFYQKISQRDIDWKLLDCEGDNKGYSANVYSLNGQIRKIEIPYFDKGYNGFREFYYRASGELGLVIDYDNRAYQVNKYYHLLGLNKVWNFMTLEDISEDTDYIEALSIIDADLSENKEFILDFTHDSFSDIKNKITDKLKAATFNTGSPIFLKGSLDFKHPIIMSLNFKENKVLTGKYRYQKSKQDIILKGSWEGQRFELKEYDTKGTITGEFKGQLINKNTVAGLWTNTKTDKNLYFETVLTDAYSFVPKTIKDDEIGKSQAGIFKIGESFPELPKGFTSEVEQQVTFNEGMRYVQYITHVKKEGKHLLDCVIEENSIQEITVLDGYKTPDGIGVGSSLEEFIKVYIKHHIWYTYVSDRYVIDTDFLGENIQFILSKDDYLFTTDFNEDVHNLKFSNFKKGSKIISIIIY
jgi:hypothetical protein